MNNDQAFQRAIGQRHPALILLLKQVVTTPIDIDLLERDLLQARST